MNLAKVFDQYLRTTMVPDVRVSHSSGDTLEYRWADVVPGFDMPVRVTLDWPDVVAHQPTSRGRRRRVKLANPTDFRVDENFYVVPKAVDATSRP